MSQVGMLIGPVLSLGLAVLLAMGLALGSVWLALRVHAGARAGLALIAVAALLDGLMVTPRSVVLGIHVYPADPVFVLIAAVAAWRWIRQPGPPSGAGQMSASLFVTITWAIWPMVSSWASTAVPHSPNF